MTKKKAQVSVIATVLNEENNINELLDALINQTYMPAEIVIVDGGSVDSTWQKLQQRRKNFPLPLVIRQQPGNRSVGRNTAIKLAKCELIAITDAGCFPEPTWLAELLAAVPQPQPEKIVVAGYYTAYPSTPLEEAIVPYALVMPDKVNPDAFLPATRSMLLSKSVWKELGGFDAALSDNEDYAFAKKIQSAKIEIVFTGDACVVWQPPSTWKAFAQMIFRFARGDAFALIWRPKVALIFVRYFLLAMLCVFSWWSRILALAMLMLYGIWSMKKNSRYTKKGWYWLPILQFTADFEVMKGTLSGLRNRWQLDRRKK